MRPGADGRAGLDGREQEERVMRKAMIWVAAGVFLGVMAFSAPGAVKAETASGKQIFTERCGPCHGPNGEGNGPLARVFNPKPVSFHGPGFWQSDNAKKIPEIIKKGKGQMLALPLNDAEIKAVIDYMTQTFKK
jgi:mono/diheme cytochrome c family protein